MAAAHGGHGEAVCNSLRDWCEEHRTLKTAGVDAALDAVRLHAASNARFIDALAQLARYKLEIARGDEGMADAVCAAVEARRVSLVGDPTLEHRQLGGPWQEVLGGPLQEGGDADALLRRLAMLEEEARDRVEAAERAMPRIEDLEKLVEDEWQHHYLERDNSRQGQVQLAELRIAGLSAKKRYIERALVCVRKVSEGLVVPELPIGVVSAVAETSASAPPLLTSCAELVRSVHEMHRETCNEQVRREIMAIAARAAAQCHDRAQMLQDALAAVSAELRAAHQALQAPASLLARRTRVEGLLATLQTLQQAIRAAKKERRDAETLVGNLEDETAPGDTQLEKAQARLERLRHEAAALALRRDGVLAEVDALSAKPGHDGTVGNEQDPIPLDFPEVALRAYRVVTPFREVYERLNVAQRKRFDIEVLLRRAGLLACERSYASYSGLAVIVANKANVKRACLRAAAPGTEVKILKEFGVEEFKRVKRAVQTASRLRHPGIVPVECAFLERGDVVVVQSPFFMGGNMRQWARDKDADARLRSLQRVAEAVRFLHEQRPSILHRDIKPENVVFDSESPTGTPALCDFDMSVDALDTMASTMMRGTLLYLAPDTQPSTASDVFALGVTLLDVLFCDADQERLRQLLLGDLRAVAAISDADLERVRSHLERRAADTDGDADANVGELATLVRSMLSPQPRARPDARAVAERLGELLHVRTCCICHCPEPRDKGLACAAAARHFACDGPFFPPLSLPPPPLPPSLPPLPPCPLSLSLSVCLFVSLSLSRMRMVHVPHSIVFIHFLYHVIGRLLQVQVQVQVLSLHPYYHSPRLSIPLSSIPT